MELLSPAGNLEKLKSALHFGADAVYLAGKNYGLRSAADNFDADGLSGACALVHGAGKKVYVTLNILAHNSDFEGLADYIKYLDGIAVDGVIVSDLGIMTFVKKYAPSLNVHISTQASVTNKYAAKFYAEQGASRIVLARELSLPEIREIRDFIPSSVELEAFVHGAMCISYSGRCLMSDFMTGRHANHGECAQSCRWEYAVAEKTRGEYMPVEEDGRGTYIFNSKDMNMIEFLPELKAAGVHSLKIEGRIKSAYYVASVTNAYRRALDILEGGGKYVLPEAITDCLYKTSHRKFTTGFYFGEKDRQCYETAKPQCDYDFCGVVVANSEGGAVVEMRGRFARGDEHEVLSPSAVDGAVLKVGDMTDEKGAPVSDAYRVQQHLFVKTDLKLEVGDMLRKKSSS